MILAVLWNKGQTELPGLLWSSDAYLSSLDHNVAIFEGISAENRPRQLSTAGTNHSGNSQYLATVQSEASVLDKVTGADVARLEDGLTDVSLNFWERFAQIPADHHPDQFRLGSIG